MAATAPTPGSPNPPPADLGSICFRNQWFLGAVGGVLSPANVFDYFAGSPFYDVHCNNELLRLKGLHPLDSTQLKTMVGWEYALHLVQEPLLYVLKKQKRESPEKATVSTVYYVLEGSVYQAPTAHGIITARVARSLHHLTSALSGFRALLSEGPLATQISPSLDTLSASEGAETSRMDIILRSALQRLPPAPVPQLLQPSAGGNDDKAGANDDKAGADSDKTLAPMAATSSDVPLSATEGPGPSNAETIMGVSAPFTAHAPIPAPRPKVESAGLAKSSSGKKDAPRSRAASSASQGQAKRSKR